MNDRTYVPLATGLAVVGLAACREASGSGRPTTKTIPVAPFTRVVVSEGFDLTLAHGDRDEVTLRLDGLFDDVQVEVSDGTLRIGARGWVHDAMLHADINAHAMSDIAVTVSGGSRLYSDVHTARVDLELSGASRATLSGTAAHLVTRATGASVLELGAMRADEARISLSGASQATVLVDETIAVDLTGASQLRYRGDAVIVRQEISGSSLITTNEAP